AIVRISHILIRDFATIENTEVSFHKGLNAITGETGAGKSVVASAISLALGSRADTSMVRTGCETATVQMVAEYNNHEVIITREISTTGKNFCRIDDRIVTLNELQELCSKIADVHGQYDNQSLLNVDRHLGLVDDYEHNAIAPVRKKVAELYENYIDAGKRLEEARKKIENNDEMKELLTFQIDEIEKAALIPGEEDKHREELEVMENNERIYAALDEAYAHANGEDISAMSKLDSVIMPMRNITQFSREAADIEDELSDFYYRFEDIANRIRDMRDKIVFNPNRIEELNDRLHFIKELKKKYGETIDEIHLRRDSMESELHALNNLDSEVDSLQLEYSRIEEMLANETENLTRLRKSSADSLQGKIQAELENLNFNNAQISIDFDAAPDFSPNGVDKVEFLLTTNVGEPLKPLSKIASGGEMSRIMLAFKKVIGVYDGIGTMIFDEIDSGISGETADIVAKELGQISKSHQLIIITHLPQIAASAEHNYRIEKSDDNFRTYTVINELSEKEKITEIARLLAGVNISDITLASAQEMINLAGSRK
ncbi:MAG: DNA repair protein RecN, partial [Firmicutes bacterium]|nr:DNA repair protein RecN [Bacillota bacterium]